jgi:Pro-kumamolisin, activation domain/Abnormal spindle-like microcephaly-assoc'd, ASPM-SPD-2-Hydin
MRPAHLPKIEVEPIKERFMRYCYPSSSANGGWTRPCLLIVALYLLASWPTLAQTSDSVALSGHVPLKVQNGTATLVGHYNPNQMLRLGLAVQAPHMQEEEQFIKELVTKGSPNFHKFLTAEEWDARFAPSTEDEQAVVDWAKSQGLTVTSRHADRLMVDLEGPAGVIEKAFGVTINNYRVGDEVDFSNDRDPAIPRSLSGILHTVVGLNNIERVHRMGSKRTTKGPDYVPGPVYSEGENTHGDGDPTKAPTKRATNATSTQTLMSNPTPSDSYPLRDIAGLYAANPDNIQSSEGYDYNALQRLSFCCNEPGASGSSPPESSIALVGYGAFSTTDISTFFEYYGMAWNINWYCIGGSTCPAVDGEAPLDVEYSGAMSNSYASPADTAHIYEYEITNDQYITYYDAFEDIQTNNTAKVVSTSYGFEENVGFSGSYATGTMHPLFNKLVGQGFTLIAASGDNGSSYGCGDATAVSYPSSDPDFLAAGGTELLLNTSGIFQSETAWQGEFWSGACASNHGGSTGGVSVLFSAPSWQSTLVSPYYEWIGSTEYEVTGNTNRLVPDISLTANPDVMGEWYYSGGAWQDEGGTSIVAPELAGFFAQENSYLDHIGNVCGSGSTACSPVGYASPWIYYDALPGFGAPHNPFYDMTSGCNDNDNTVFWNLVYYCAAPGYDLVTGWGSANMLQLAWGINWQMIPGDGQPVIRFYSSPAINTWYNTSQEVNWEVTDSTTNAYPATGVAGFTQGWDSIPSDPSSEPHGGEGNSFYSGPEYAYGTLGCLSFVAGGCAGGVSQGWHTVRVEAWDNQGRTATGSYGPIGYDTIAPVTTAALSGTLISGTTYKSAVTVTLSASDPGYPSTGSGVKITYYYLNSGAWKVYSGPFSVPYSGSYTVHFFSYDKAGNAETLKTASFTIEPAVSVSPATLAFGNQVLGTTSAGKSVTITNISGSSVSLSSPKASGDYTVSGSTCATSLAAGGHCTITVTFKPSIVGSVSGDLTVAYSGGVGAPDRIGLSGAGLTPLAASPTSLVFGTVTVGTTSPAKTLTLTNDNPSTALSISVAYSKDYATSGGTCGASLAGGASCTVDVTFTPHQNGAINGAVSVTDGVAQSPLVVALSGGGSGGAASPLTFSPTSASFTNVVVGTSASKSVTVKNVSASSVKITSALGSGDYSASGCVTSLLPLATCVLTVNFKPSSTGSINGAIAVTNNTGENPDVLDASGTAILPVTISPTSVNLGSWIVGTTSSSATVTVTNHTASAVSIAYTASGDFSAVSGGTTPCSSSLAAGAQCTFLVSATPTTTGAVSGVATVAYSAGYGPQEVKLSATGQ